MASRLVGSRNRYDTKSASITPFISLFPLILYWSELCDWSGSSLSKRWSTRIWYDIATAKTVRTFLIPETLDSTNFFP